MTLVRWNPLTLDTEIDRMMRDLWGDLPAGNGVAWNPTVDITEHENFYEVHAELPGLTREDVKVTLEKDVLTIEGEKKRSAETREENVRRAERRYGRFSRAFRLNEDVDPTKIAAVFKDGVLTLTLPKAEAVKPRSIEVQVA